MLGLGVESTPELSICQKVAGKTQVSEKKTKKKGQLTIAPPHCLSEVPRTEIHRNPAWI